MKNIFISQKGFTLAEVVVVFGIVAMIFGLAYSSTMKAQQSTSLESALALLVSDIKNQQVNAMTGFTLGGPELSNFGVYFGTSSYTLFKGDVYNPSDQTNLVVNLPTNVLISSVNLPSSTLLFLKGNGEVSGWVGGSDNITLGTNLLTTKTVRINRLGVITAVN